MISKGKTQIHLKIFAQSKSQNRPKQGGVFLLRGGFLIKVTTDVAALFFCIEKNISKFFGLKKVLKIFEATVLEV